MRLTEKEFELVYARWRDTPLEGVKPDGQMFRMIKEAEDAKEENPGTGKAPAEFYRWAEDFKGTLMAASKTLACELTWGAAIRSRDAFIGQHGVTITESKPDRRAELLDLAEKIAVTGVRERGLPSGMGVKEISTMIVDYAKTLIDTVDAETSAYPSDVVPISAQTARELLAWFAKLDDWSGVGDPPNLDDLKAALA